jgi:hypothetical protein
MVTCISICGSVALYKHGTAASDYRRSLARVRLLYALAQQVRLRLYRWLPARRLRILRRRCLGQYEASLSRHCHFWEMAASRRYGPGLSFISSYSDRTVFHAIYCQQNLQLNSVERARVAAGPAAAWKVASRLGFRADGRTRKLNALRRARGVDRACKEEGIENLWSHHLGERTAIIQREVVNSIALDRCQENVMTHSGNPTV